MDIFWSSANNQCSLSFTLKTETYIFEKTNKQKTTTNIDSCFKIQNKLKNIKSTFFRTYPLKKKKVDTNYSKLKLKAQTTTHGDLWVFSVKSKANKISKSSTLQARQRVLLTAPPTHTTRPV